MATEILQKPVPVDGKVSRQLIGSIMILPEQLIHVYDERGLNGCVRLVCINTNNSKGVLWHNLVKTSELTSPVRMSNVTIRSNEDNLLTFAVGLRVFLVRFRRGANTYDNVGSISSLKIDDVEAGSWVSSVNAHFSLDEDIIDFFVTLDPKNELRGYKVTGEVIKSIDLGLIPSSISQVASAGNVFAVTADGQDGVVLLKSIKAVRRYGSLKPTSRGIRLQTLSVIWTGSLWMVLGVDQAGSSWAVVAYKRTGELLKVCDEDSCDGAVLPVCVSRFGNDGFVSFDNGDVRSFKF